VIPLDAVLARLEDVHRTRRGWSARCPAHRDRSPSLSVLPRADGGAFLRCWAGCERRAVLMRLGLDEAPMSQPQSAHRLSVHALALRLARSQPWADPLARELYRMADYIRSCDRRADALRRVGTNIGPTVAAWDALAHAAACERTARWAEAALDEGLT
jgi:hypothetical protein